MSSTALMKCSRDNPEVNMLCIECLHRWRSRWQCHKLCRL